MNNLQILGMAGYTPKTRITNADLAKYIDTNDEWIVTRTGIQSRHKLEPELQNSDMGYHAAKSALENANISPEAITHVLVATCSADASIPNTACLIATKLGMTKAMAFDINAACSGFIYALDVAQAMISANPDACMLVVASEVLTRRVNWSDRGTCVLFGDGAAALVVSANKNLQGQSIGSLEACLCRADGKQASLLRLGCGTTKECAVGDVIDESAFIQMEGREVFKVAVRSMTSISLEILEQNNLTINDIDLFIPHQANLRIIEAVGQRLKVDSGKVFVNVAQMGNTSAASIPLALVEAHETGALRPGMRVLLATFGGGFTWGSALLQW